MKINSFIVTFIALVALTSCGAHQRAEWHLNRAFTLNPGLKQSRFAYVRDTIVIKGQEVVDTVTLTETDTVEVGNDTIKAIVYKYKDRWVVRVKYETQEVPVEVKVPVTEYHCPEKSLFEKYWWQIFIALTSIVGVGAIIERKK